MDGEDICDSGDTPTRSEYRAQMSLVRCRTLSAPYGSHCADKWQCMSSVCEKIKACCPAFSPLWHFLPHCRRYCPATYNLLQYETAKTQHTVGSRVNFSAREIIRSHESFAYTSLCSYVCTRINVRVQNVFSLTFKVHGDRE
jgi:hypothetical protein